MNFLLKHYEKLILVVCLLAVLCAAYMGNSASQEAQSERKKGITDADRAVKGGKMVEEVTEMDSLLKIQRDLNLKLDVSPEFTSYNWTNDDAKGSLLQPIPFIQCPGEKCSQMILLTADKCPFCGAVLPVAGKQPSMADDLDGDGIPDQVEQKLEGLNYRKKSDAEEDIDQDGFTNMEEYQRMILVHNRASGKTGGFATLADFQKAPCMINDPNLFPPLALLLRVQRVTRPNLVYKVNDIERGNPVREKAKFEDKKQWEVNIKYNEGRREVRANGKKIGDAIGEFIIKDIYVVDDVPHVKMVSKENAEEEYDISNQKNFPSKCLMVEFYFLDSRSEEDLPSIRRKRIYVKEGRTFKVKKMKNEQPYEETYKLVSADMKTGTAVVTLVAPGPGENFKVAKFDQKTDMKQSKEGSRQGMDGEDMPRDMPPDGPRKGRPAPRKAPRR